MENDKTKQGLLLKDRAGQSFITFNSVVKCDVLYSTKYKYWQFYCLVYFVPGLTGYKITTYCKFKLLLHNNSCTLL